MKKLVVIILLITICISFYEIISTFALYKNELTGEYSSSLGIWSITVNEEDIRNGVIAYNYMKHFNSGVQHSANGKIAPGDTLYFDVVIDPTNTDVSIFYELNVAFESEDFPNLMNNIQITSIECEFIDGEEQTEENENCIVKDDNSATRGIIPLARINAGEITRIRVYFSWANNEANNETDTEIGRTIDADFQASVELVLKQYTGEELEQWETNG